jgi:hypothetical protein
MKQQDFEPQRFSIFESDDGSLEIVAENTNGELTPAIYIDGQRQLTLQTSPELSVFDTLADRTLTQSEARFRLEQAGLELDELSP